MTDRLHIVFPGRPASLKNSQRLITNPRTGKLMPISSRKAVADKKALRALIEQACAMAGWETVDQDSFAIYITQDVDNDRTVIDVERLGERPKGKSGRRSDLHNMPDIVCDTMEGLVFRNDNQVAYVELRRVVGGRVA